MLAAIGVFAAPLLGVSLDRLYVGAMAFEGEPWRLLSSVLVHGDAFHLVFNLYWLWVFGSYIERELGALRWLLLVLGSGVVASLAEYGVSNGGIGLSGVGYAQLGFLWMLSRRSERYRDAMDGGTVRLFIIWGLLCVVLDSFGIMNIGNAAHLSGLLFGVLFGFIHTGPGIAVRAGAAVLLLMTAALSYVAATSQRPYWNLRDRDATELCYLGYSALAREETQLGRRLLEQAALYPKTSADCWVNIAYARWKSGDQAGYRMANERAETLRQAIPSP